MLKEVGKYSGCFVCGDKNPAGLQVKFYADENGAIGEYTAQEQFQGYHGILHGGITAALLDEIMIKAVFALDVVVVTAEMTARFKRPIRTGQKVTFAAKIVNRRGRIYETEGEGRLEDGTVVASATGKYLLVQKDFEDELGQSLGT